MSSYFDEPFFQNGVVAQAIKTVEAEGVTYVTAAGNNASNGYQAAWTPISGSFDGTYLTDTESFGGKVVQTVTINTEGTNDTVPLILQWNQPYGAATSDLEDSRFPQWNPLWRVFEHKRRPGAEQSAGRCAASLGNLPDRHRESCPARIPA